MKLSKRWGQVPDELHIGFLVNRFNQTPHQLGFCETPDLALLYRALQAAHVHAIGERAYGEAETLSIDEGLLAGKLAGLVAKRRVSKNMLNRTL